MDDKKDLLGEVHAISVNSAALHFLFKVSEKAIKDKIIVLSPGSFSGNSKYIYSYLHHEMKGKGSLDKLFWLSHNKVEAEYLRKQGINVHLNKQDGPSMRLLVETKVAFMSTHHFPRADYCVMQAALSAAVKVQMWHGIPAKKIAYELAGKKGSAINFAYFAYDCLSADYIVAESSYVTPRYQQGFPRAIPIIAGSVRTDVLLADLERFPFWKVGIQPQIIERMLICRNKGMKVAIYAPTYREASQNRSAFFLELKNFLQAVKNDEKTLLIVKNHSSSKDQEVIEGIVKEINSDRIILISSADDIYPYMRQADILITDYSSIYYDFLLTNRQVIFFQPDFNAYTATRDIYDEQEILGCPLGFKVHNGDACYEAMFKTEPVDYATNRKYLLNKLFSSIDGESSMRLLDYLKSILGPNIFS